MLNKISRKTAGTGIISMNLFTIIVFLLVIAKILPYTSIGGGRLDSFQSAYQTAVTSIGILTLGIPAVAVASGLINVKPYRNFFRVWLLLDLAMVVYLLSQFAIIGAFIVCFGIPLIAIAAGLLPVERYNLCVKVYLWLSFTFVCLNTLGNLLGVTLFEKIIMGTVTVIQAILYLRLATGKNSAEKAFLS